MEIHDKPVVKEEEVVQVMEEEEEEEANEEEEMYFEGIWAQHFCNFLKKNRIFNLILISRQNSFLSDFDFPAKKIILNSFVLDFPTKNLILKSSISNFLRSEGFSSLNIRSAFEMIEIMSRLTLNL